MEPSKGDPPKLPDMVMCGDHPSITKTELNTKEERPDDKTDHDKKDRLPGYARISPSVCTMEARLMTLQAARVCLQTSRTGAAPPAPGAAPPGAGPRSRAPSEHALRLLEARRQARSLDLVARHEDINAPANRALVQAALGSFRWPPYLVAVWVAVLVLTHVLHCLVTALERALPPLKKFCTYFRAWTESCWRGDAEVSHRLFPLALAALTALLYTAYVGLYAVYAVALWAVEPLCAEDPREDETKVTDYVVDDVTSKQTPLANNLATLASH